MHPEFKFRDRNIEFNSSGHVVSNLTTPLITTASSSGAHASHRDPPPATQSDKPAAETHQESKPIAEEKEAEKEAAEDAREPDLTPEKTKPLDDVLTEQPSDSKLQDDPPAGGAAVGNGGVDLEDGLNSRSVEKAPGKEEANTSLDLTVPPLPLSAQQMVSDVSAEERRLLFRVKWLLQRFRDSASHDLRIEHTQKSLDLLIEVPLLCETT